LNRLYSMYLLLWLISQLKIMFNLNENNRVSAVLYLDGLDTIFRHTLLMREKKSPFINMMTGTEY